MYEKRLVLHDGDWCVYDYNRDVVDRMFATINSYLGHFKHANSFKLILSFWRRDPFLSRYFELDSEKMKILRRYVLPDNLRTVRRQYGYF